MLWSEKTLRGARLRLKGGPGVRIARLEPASVDARLDLRVLQVDLDEGAVALVVVRQALDGVDGACDTHGAHESGV